MFYVISYVNLNLNICCKMRLFAENKQKALEIFYSMHDSDIFLIDHISEADNIRIKEVVS